MAEVKLTSTLLSHSDVQTILTSVKAYIDAQVEAANGDTTAVANLLNALIGADKAAEGEAQKTVRAISAEEVAKIVANADANYDTLKEIADWIMSDTTGAAKMANDITALQTAVGSNGETKTGLYELIANEVARATQAEKEIQDECNSRDEATSAALTDHNTRIETLEAKFTGDESVESQIATAKSEAIAAAAADATTKVNGLKDTAVSATSTSGPVKVDLGGTVGAPTVTVAVTMATEAEVKTLTDLFAVEA